MIKCKRCGEESINIKDSLCKNCNNEKRNIGWECPKCGRTFAPSIVSCPDCSKPSISASTNSEGIKFEGRTILMG